VAFLQLIMTVNARALYREAESYVSHHQKSKACASVDTPSKQSSKQPF